MADIFEDKLRGVLGEELEKKVEGKISEFGGLLTRGAAVRLLCRQNGIDVEQRVSLREALSSHLPFSFEAKIGRIFPVQAYPGRMGRSVRLHLSDGTAEATAVLWNEQASLVEGALSVGDTVRCTGAYVRFGEIAVAKNGRIEKVAGTPPLPVPKLTAGVCNVEGEVGEIEMPYEYLDKKTGGKRTLCSFQLCGQGECRRVVVWSFPEGSPGYSSKDLLLLENVLFRNGEIHFNSHSRMVRKSSASEKSGKLLGIGLRQREAVFSLENESLALPLESALAILGINSVPQGVSLETLILIKSQELSGRKIRYRVEQGKLAWLSG